MPGALEARAWAFTGQRCAVRYETPVNYKVRLHFRLSSSRSGQQMIRDEKSASSTTIHRVSKGPRNIVWRLMCIYASSLACAHLFSSSIYTAALRASQNIGERSEQKKMALNRRLSGSEFLSFSAYSILVSRYRWAREQAQRLSYILARPSLAFAGWWPWRDDRPGPLRSIIVDAFFAKCRRYVTHTRAAHACVSANCARLYMLASIHLAPSPLFARGPPTSFDFPCATLFSFFARFDLQIFPSEWNFCSIKGNLKVEMVSYRKAYARPWCFHYFGISWL